MCGFEFGIPLNEMVAKIEKRDKTKDKKQKEAEALTAYNKILKKEKEEKTKKEFEARLRKEKFDKLMAQSLLKR